MMALRLEAKEDPDAMEDDPVKPEDHEGGTVGYHFQSIIAKRFNSF